MSVFHSASPRWSTRVLSVLRIVVGVLYVMHGTQKLFGNPPSPAMKTPVALASMFGIAGILETFGGGAIILGLLTRPVAFVLCGEMAVAFFTQHFKRGFIPLLNGGELAVLYCFIYLYFVFAGAGPWSVDALIAQSRAGSPTTPSPQRDLHHAA
ncbi:MAG: DoxX family protein [Gemmatimonadaceae bacterium]